VIVLDTTVLVYAVGGDHHLRAPCRALLARIQDGHVRASTTPEVIQEFMHVRARRRPRPEVIALASDYAVALAPLVVVEARDLQEGLGIYERCPALGAFDAVLAAVVLNRGAQALVSADRAFSSVDDLRVINPGADGFTQQIEALAGR
jgi:hypothetical protein